MIDFIDLSNDYYLGIFSHDEDHNVAIMDEPWFIYDHYFIVKEWNLNFHLASDIIENVVV